MKRGSLAVVLTGVFLTGSVHAQWNYTTNNGAITITGYTGSGGAVAIPGILNGLSVAKIGTNAFLRNTGLVSVTVPNTVAIIELGAFAYCPSLTGAYFKGNAPSIGASAFDLSTNATVYYLPGTTGWTNPWGGRPTVCWNPTARNLGAASNQFGSDITGSSNLVIVVEACTNLAGNGWVPVSTNTLTGGVSSFSDREWTNSPARFYRFRPGL